MLYALTILLPPARTGANPGDLGLLNTLGLAVFLVGIGLILLLVIHWYRMKDALARKQKTRLLKSARTGDFDPLGQLQYMSREELKAMILKEREENAVLLNAAEKARQSVEPIGGVPVALDRGASGPQPVPSKTPDQLRQMPDENLPAGLTSPPEEQPAEQPKEPPKHPYYDKIQRSILSSELPEEFRKKSRKV